MKGRKSMGMVLIALVMAGTFSSGRAAAQSQSGQPGQPGQSGQPAPKMKCQERFAAMDVNHDAMVTKAEFTGFRNRRGRAEEVFKTKDTNGDGMLTKDEVCAGKGMGRGMGKVKMQ